MMLWEMSALSRLAPAETCGFYCLWKLVLQIKGSKDSGADCQQPALSGYQHQRN